MIYAYQCKSKKTGKWVDALTINDKKKAVQTFRRMKKSMPEFEHRVIGIEVVVKETVIAE